MSVRHFRFAVLFASLALVWPFRAFAWSPTCIERSPNGLSAVRFNCPNEQPVYARAGVIAEDKPGSHGGESVARPFVKTADTEVVTAPRYTGEELSWTFTPRDVETTAGTFGDPSRYLQSFAGVIADNDQRNDFLVRGGNPSENGFVIDGIEIPSINQLALSDTTGGFVSMLDAAAVQRITLHTDAYDSKFDERLSSIVDISTRPLASPESHNSTEVGLAGVGGSITRPWGKDGSYFLSGRRSVLNFMTNDIGMDGVPIYYNSFLRADSQIDSHDSWWGISLTGIDSIKIQPSVTDNAETTPYNVDYSGWRNTTGIDWQHVFSSKAFGIASVAHSQQDQTVKESAQLLADATIYNENTRDGIWTFKYDLTFQRSRRVTLNGGARLAVDALNYSVSQPIGLQNPYSQNPSFLDSSSFSRNFATASSAAYAEAVITLPLKAKVILGERGMQWALGGHSGSTSKATFSMPLFGRLISVGYSQLEQLPSTLYLLSFNNLSSLKPIRSSQFTGVMQLADNKHEKVTLEVYQKRYSDYPVAQNYPQLSTANIADTFGQAFLMFPMAGSGKGIARGVELTMQTRLTSRLTLTLTTAYARCWYSGLDGILRRGNYDIPASANLTGTWTVGRGILISWRYNETSGRPYTPDNMPMSLAQNRDVYQLDQINSLRSSDYERVDFRLEQSRKIGNGIVTWDVGVQNALNRKNFYSRLWEPQINSNQTGEQDQMPLFPDGGIKYSF